MELPSSSTSGGNDGCFNLSEPDVVIRNVVGMEDEVPAPVEEPGPPPAVLVSEAVPIGTSKKRTTPPAANPATKKSRVHAGVYGKPASDNLAVPDAFVNEVIRFVQLKEFRIWSRLVHPAPQCKKPATVGPFLEWVKKKHVPARSHLQIQKRHMEQRYDLVGVAIYQAALPEYSKGDYVCGAKYKPGDEVIAYFYPFYLNVKIEEVLEPRLNEHSGRPMPVYRVQRKNKNEKKVLEELFELDMWPAALPQLRSFQALLAHYWNEHCLRNSSKPPTDMFRLTEEAVAEQEARWMKEATVRGMLRFMDFVFDVIGQEGLTQCTFRDPESRFHLDPARTRRGARQVSPVTNNPDKIAFACKVLCWKIIDGRKCYFVQYPGTWMNEEDLEATGLRKNGWITAAALRGVMEMNLRRNGNSGQEWIEFAAS